MKTHKLHLTFAICLILYVALMNTKINYTLGYDESRHAVQGHFFYDYYKTLLGGEFVGIKGFLQSYMRKGYNVGWSVLFDPPAHAMFQGLMFLFFGNNYVVARLATQTLVIFGAVIFYVLCLKIFERKWLAIPPVMLYLLMPYVFVHARESFLMVPISLLMVGWFYYYFYTKSVIGAIISGIFLALATLMKYPNLIYAGAFLIVYAGIIMFVRKKFPTSTIVKSVILVIIFFVLGGWWIKLSLFDYNMKERIWFEGAVRGERTDGLFFIKNTILQTKGFALFALIPLISWVKKRKESFVSNNWRMGLFVLTTYVIASFLITNLQLRYMIAAVPFLFIFAVQGTYETANFIYKRNSLLLNLFIIIMISIVYIAGDSGMVKSRVETSGKHNDELTNYLNQVPVPRLFVYIKGGGERSVNYYDTPDLFAFNAMTIHPNNNPEKSLQWVDIQFWEKNLEYHYKDYAKYLNETSYKTSMVIPIFRFEPHCTLLEMMGKELESYGFESTNLTYYVVYERIV